MPHGYWFITSPRPPSGRISKAKTPKPEDTSWQWAAVDGGKKRGMGLDYLLLLVGGGDRLVKFRLTCHVE